MKEEYTFVNDVWPSCPGLPEPDEIIILESGLVLIDADNELSDTGEPVLPEVYCG